MQALSLAIGPAGIEYFGHQLVAPQMIKELAGLKPPDKTISVPDFNVGPSGAPTDEYSNVAVALTGKSLGGFTPAADSFVQSQETFVLALQASGFSAEFAWHESYHDRHWTLGWNDQWYWADSDGHGDYDYIPTIGVLHVTVTAGFKYDEQSNTYDVVVVGSPAGTATASAGIPAASILQNEDQGCTSSHISDATATAISALDFSTPIAALFEQVVASIPASGQLTPDIKYDFAIGDSKITFPGGAGIAIGVTGSVSYKDGSTWTPYPGAAPPPVPVPVPPAASDPHHLQLYVSGYELDALHWAYWKAGGLTVTVEPSDLPDPDVLKCKTYKSVPGFAQYEFFGMHATVAPIAAPKIAFQMVWHLTDDVEKVLKAKLPTNVYTLIDSDYFQGSAYSERAAFETDMKNAGIDATYWPPIEKAASATGMVVTQDLEFTLTIDTGKPSEPNLVFDVARTDILSALQLGTSGGAQTLKFEFAPVSSAATFKSTTIEGFVGGDAFGETIWPNTGEPHYDNALSAVGKAGSPLPIMSGLQFVFDQAQLSIQEGYVSILAEVEAKTATADGEAAAARPHHEPATR